MNFKYNANTGEEPQLGDHVEVCHSGPSMDTITGRIGGWQGERKLIALVLLDVPLLDGSTILAMPVVCLKKPEFDPDVTYVDLRGHTGFND